MNKRVGYIIFLVLLNIGLDQYSKHFVRAEVLPGSRTEIVGKLLQLMNVENSGAFLGIGSDSHPTIKLIFLLILPVIVLGVVHYYLLTNRSLDRISVIGFSCVAGGGIANLAGVDKGPPPQSGPNSQGLQGLFNRVKKV